MRYWHEIEVTYTVKGNTTKLDWHILPEKLQRGWNNHQLLFENAMRLLVGEPIDETNLIIADKEEKIIWFPAGQPLDALYVWYQAWPLTAEPALQFITQTAVETLNGWQLKLYVDVKE